MKKMQKEIKTYTDIYVSVDGREFENQEDCEAWEKSYKGTMVASWNLIEKEQVSDCSLGLPWSSDDHECYVIKPKTLDEITLINAYIQSSTYDNCAILTTNHIGKLIAVNFGYDHDYCDIYILEEHVNEIAKYVSELAEKFN